jgi:putative thioredoxin
MSESPYIINVTSQNFNTVVIEQSFQVLVLVDFWAEWCAPCKMLLPVLTELVEEYQGQLIIGKVNIDEQQGLAGRYSVRSIPTLKLFKEGTVVEEAMGAQPAATLRQLIDHHRERPSDQLRFQAIQAYQEGDSERAIHLLEQAREMEPTHYPVSLELVKILISNQRVTEAEAIIKALPVNVQTEPEVIELTAQLTFAMLVADAPPMTILVDRLAKNPNDHEARYQLSAHQVMAGEYEVAMDNLLELMRRNRQYQEDAGRKGLLAIFTLLGNQGPLVNRYRSKMSSLLY